MSPPLPHVLQELEDLDLSWITDSDLDYRPRHRFRTDSDTREWWRAWTGNHTEGTPPLRFFATDSTGGVFALWARVNDCPVVYLGSEGELAVLAKDALSFVALLAGGGAPAELALAQHRRAKGRPPRDEPIRHDPVPALIAIWRRAGGEGEPPDPEGVATEAEPIRRDLAAWVERTVR